jgi:hypothetical protein
MPYCYIKSVVYCFSFVALFLLAGSCKKDKNTPPVLFVTPDAAYYSAKPADIIRFEIRGTSVNILSKFTITSKAGNSFTKTEKDSTIRTADYYSYFEYLVPDFSQNTSVVLEFSITDEKGLQTRVGKVINVEVKDKTLTETAGHEMYSALSAKQDAYNLIIGQPIFSSTAPINEQHIKDTSKQDSMNTTGILSRRWDSPAGLNFVKFNSFDYANATYVSVKNAYSAGIKKEFVDNLMDGDIILTKLNHSSPDSGYAAIKIIYVLDWNSTNFDRYVFSLKK